MSASDGFRRLRAAAEPARRGLKIEYAERLVFRKGAQLRFALG
jgi:hypothetical protein